MTDEKEKELGRQVKFYKDMCLHSYNTYSQARLQTNNLRANWDDWRERYEKADRELAEIDGRLEVVTHAEKKDISIVLTEEQIIAIAQRLDIKIELPE